ncbi:hypothetical protein [Nonomuraea sp. C10]|uniref:hypothetical protein n=1 Tax=Nonomuraea sp. C10 TaxID=2600577 RepID=UPI0011CE9CAB|nr:hypothetical protein [Nonomuraea sp. C10]TXK35473.1 hypothetical protein FR742_40345 [Nonomuraea sp. C10]
MGVVALVVIVVVLAGGQGREKPLEGAGVSDGAVVTEGETGAGRWVPDGFPDAGSTGVPVGTELVVVAGDRTFAVDGEVVEGREFRGFVTVTGRGVTFRKCRFLGGKADRVRPLLDTEHARDTVIEDSEFRPAHPSPSVDGIWAAHTSILRSEFTGTVDGIKAHTGTLVRDSYIHDLSWFPEDPDQGGGPTHNDGVQAFADQTGVTLEHNTIDLSTTRDPNAAVQSSADDLRVEDNYLDGGACVVNIDHTPLGRPLRGQHVTGNRFGRASAYDCPILLSTASELADGGGNVWHDTGGPIPEPERHD